MAPGKAPAFQFYARDFLTGVATMGLAERGAYISLLAHQWDSGAVPASPKERARVLGCTLKEEQRVWQALCVKFTPVDAGYQNMRLEEERNKQAEYRRRQSDAGKASAATRRQPDTQPESNHGSTTVQPPLNSGSNQNSTLLSSSSSSSSEKEKNTVPSAPAKPLISGQSNPRDWGRIHGNHVAGFCDWVCLPDFVFEEFRSKSPGPEYVKGWAARVREQFEGQTIGEDGLRFWRRQWSESHRTPVLAKPFRDESALDQKLAAIEAKAAKR